MPVPSLTIKTTRIIPALLQAVLAICALFAQTQTAQASPAKPTSGDIVILCQGNFTEKAQLCALFLQRLPTLGSSWHYVVSDSLRSTDHALVLNIESWSKGHIQAHIEWRNLGANNAGRTATQGVRVIDNQLSPKIMRAYVDSLLVQNPSAVKMLTELSSR